MQSGLLKGEHYTTLGLLSFCEPKLKQNKAKQKTNLLWLTMGLVMDGCLSIENQVGHAQKWPRETHLSFLPRAYVTIQRCSACPLKVPWMNSPLALY